MKNSRIKFLSFSALSFFIAIGVVSCGDDDNGGTEFNENEYVGTYIGKHIINDPTLNSIIQELDPENTDGSFDDTIAVTTGADPNDKIMEFTSALLNGETIQADLSKSSQNVIPKDFGTLVLGDSIVVTIENAKVKATSKITPSNGNTFGANLRLSGTLKAGSITFPIGDLATVGTFTKQ